MLKNCEREFWLFIKIDEIHHAIEKLKEYPYKEYKREHFYTKKFLIFSMKRLEYKYQLQYFVTNENNIKDIKNKIKAIEQFLEREYGTKMMMMNWNKNDDDDEYQKQLKILEIIETDYIYKF